MLNTVVFRPLAELGTTLGAGFKTHMRISAHHDREYQRYWPCGCRASYRDERELSAAWIPCAEHAVPEAEEENQLRWRERGVVPCGDARAEPRAIGAVVAHRALGADVAVEHVVEHALERPFTRVAEPAAAAALIDDDLARVEFEPAEECRHLAFVRRSGIDDESAAPAMVR